MIVASPFSHAVTLGSQISQAESRPWAVDQGAARVGASVNRHSRRVDPESP